jgi:hypothetical protein
MIYDVEGSLSNRNLSARARDEGLVIQASQHAFSAAHPFAGISGAMRPDHCRRIRFCVRFPVDQVPRSPSTRSGRCRRLRPRPRARGRSRRRRSPLRAQRCSAAACGDMRPQGARAVGLPSPPHLLRHPPALRRPPAQRPGLKHRAFVPDSSADLLCEFQDEANRRWPNHAKTSGCN